MRGSAGLRVGSVSCLVWAVVVLAGLGTAASADAAGGPLYWSAPKPAVTLNGVVSSTHLACTVGLCAIVDNTGDPSSQLSMAFTSTNVTAASPQFNGGTVNPGEELYSIRCPSASLCLAVDYDDVYYSTNPSSSSPTWTDVPLGAYALDSISCPTVSFCVAIGSSSTDAGVEYATTDPTGGASAWTSNPIGSGDPLGVSCSSESLCVAFEEGGYTSVSTDPATASPTWTTTTASVDPNGIAALSCVGTSVCVGVDFEGDTVTDDDPTQEGSTWTVQSVDPGEALYSISCPSASLCVAVDYDGNALESTNPAGAAPAWSSTSIYTSGAYGNTVSCASASLCVATNGQSIVVGTSSPVGSPTATTGSAQPNGDSAETLDGTVNPNGDAVTSCQFSYGLSTSYGSTVPCTPPPGGGTSPVAVSGALAGLVPGTTYHYDLSATNSYAPVTGQDATFTTSGASPASVSLLPADSGAAYGSSTATLAGTVNPHNDPTSYRFYYGTSPETVNSAGDLGEYPSSTALTPAGRGTTDVHVSAQIGGIANDTTYYYRLAAFNDYGATWTTEGSVSTFPPVPTNTAPPYLQDSGGFDPSQGYNLLCKPGSWQNTNGHYRITWVWITNIGAVPARGTTDSGAYPGDIYEVSDQDVGHVLACEVKAYSLDGLLDVQQPGAMSETIVPSNAGDTVLPPWLKSVLELDGYGSTVADLLGPDAAIEGCLEFIDVPWLGEGLCGEEVLMFVGKYVLGNLAERDLDPPDPNYRAVAVPRRLRAPTLGHVCATHTSRAKCRLLQGDARRYVIATARVSSVLGLLYTTGNRFLVAREKRDSKTKMVQAAAWKVDAGLFASALRRQAVAGTAYADALARYHIDERATASQLRRATRLSGAQLLRRPVIRRLLATGVSRHEILATILPLARKLRNASFDLRRTLRTPAYPGAVFVRDYNTLDMTDLEALVSGLEAQHALAASAQTGLYRQIDEARAACNLRGRAAALKQLLVKAKRAMPAAYYALLFEAAQPLVKGASKTDPYRTC
jgi:hypothetical protein